MKEQDDRAALLPADPSAAVTTEPLPNDAADWFHRLDAKGRCTNMKCYQCERRGLQERIKFTENYDSLIHAVQEFLAEWEVAAPKINSFIVLQAVRSGNYDIYDGPDLGTVIDKMKTLVGSGNPPVSEASSPARRSEAKE